MVHLKWSIESRSSLQRQRRRRRAHLKWSIESLDFGYWAFLDNCLPPRISNGVLKVVFDQGDDVYRPRRRDGISNGVLKESFVW